MATAITARYANGAFTPEGEVSLEEGARVSLTYVVDREGAVEAASARDVLREAEGLLSEADREFERSLSADRWDESGVRRGSRLAWDATWMSVRRAASARGWACETPEQASKVMMRLGGVDEWDGSGGDLGLFQRFSIAEGFYERASREAGEVGRYYLHEDWQIQDGLKYIRQLVRMLACEGENPEIGA